MLKPKAYWPAFNAEGLRFIVNVEGAEPGVGCWITGRHGLSARHHGGVAHTGDFRFIRRHRIMLDYRHGSDTVCREEASCRADAFHDVGMRGSGDDAGRPGGRRQMSRLPRLLRRRRSSPARAEAGRALPASRSRATRHCHHTAYVWLSKGAARGLISYHDAGRGRRLVNGGRRCRIAGAPMNVRCAPAAGMVKAGRAGSGKQPVKALRHERS